MAKNRYKDAGRESYRPELCATWRRIPWPRCSALQATRHLVHLGVEMRSVGSSRALLDIPSVTSAQWPTTCPPSSFAFRRHLRRQSWQRTVGLDLQGAYFICITPTYRRLSSSPSLLAVSLLPTIAFNNRASSLHHTPSHCKHSTSRHPNQPRCARLRPRSFGGISINRNSQLNPHLPHVP